MELDNDITRLYKYAEKSNLPTDLIIVRPRTPEDVNITFGTEKYVLESLSEIVQRLDATLPDNSEKISDMFELIAKYNKTIDIEDFAMIYYNHLRTIYPSQDEYYTLVNEVYELEESPILLYDEAELNNKYVTWHTKIAQKTEAENGKIAEIWAIQSVLEQVSRRPKIIFSPINITSSIVAFSPTIGKRQVNPEDGIDIFDKSIVSKYVPYIKYNDKNGISYSKVYVGEKVEEEPNYNTTVIPPNESSSNNTIYMKLWHGDLDQSKSFKNEPKDSFSIIIYYLKNNYLTVESPSKDQTNTEYQSHLRTRSALPTLSFGTGKEVKVRGDFKMWGATVEEIGFLDMILSDPIVNVYLYLEENIKPFALKKRLDIHYRSIFSDINEGEKLSEEAYISNYASVSLTLTQKFSGDDTIQLADTVSRQLSTTKVPKDTPYIHVSISQAESREVVNNFIPVFSLLMRYYIDGRKDIIDNYYDFLPELEKLVPLLEQRKQKTAVEESMIVNLTKKTIVTKRAKDRLEKLRDIAPDLFILDYPGKCQHKLQPVIIDPSESDEWKEKRFGENQEERQVMPFPKDDPKWLFACPDDKNPYPGVKINKDLPNKDIYPYIPCCFKKDQIDPSSNSNYGKYVGNEQGEKRATVKLDKKISTRRLLQKDRIGFLPTAIEAIVKRYSRTYVDMVRYGVIYSKSSLIHCVCTSIDDPNYYSQTTDEMKEDYVSLLRTYIADNVNSALLKQELYDYSDEEIMQILQDKEKFLDPALFYRAVEEIFNINIYVFSVDDDNEFGYLEIPRHKIFHSRPVRPNRPTVVIMKTFGSDSIEFPQCELIVDYDIKNSLSVKLFGVEMATICHKTLTNTMRSLTWIMEENDTLSAYENIYSYIDHLNIYKLPPVTQLIDANGKMRAITFELENGKITVATIPSQPENIPNSEEIHRVSMETVIKLLGQPSAVTQDSDGKVDGLWYEIMDILHGEYISIIPEKVTTELAIGPKNPISPGNGLSITARVTKLKRDITIIVQLTRWLYELSRSRQKLDINEFADSYMVMDDWQEDSSNYYDFSNLSRRLPRVETIEKAIAILEPVVPSLFNGGKIVMYNALFAQRIIRMLKDYNNLRIGLTYVPPEFIQGFYETEDDFEKFAGSKVFTNDKDLTVWLSLSKKSSRNFLIHKKIDIAVGFSSIPYLYEDEDGNIFIVQNVFGSEGKAYAVAQEWYTEMINIGSNPEPLDTVPVNMIYGISSESTLIPIEDNTDNDSVFLKVIYYGKKADRLIGKDARWGAMLEIL